MGCEVFLCFRWSGHRNLLSDVAGRCRPDSKLPPVSVRQWTLKPPEMVKVAYSRQEEALRWMWDEMCDVAEQIQQRYPQHVPDIRRQYSAAVTTLDHADMACQWSTQKPDGTVEVIAIVSWLDDGNPLPSMYRQEVTPQSREDAANKSRRTDSALWQEGLHDQWRQTS